MSNQFNKPPGENEKLDISVRMAMPEDWEECKKIRIRSLTGPEGRMLGVTPEILEKILNQTEEEWRAETNSATMFSVLADSKEHIVALGRVKKEERDTWRIRNAYVEPEFRGQGIQSKLIALRLQGIITRGGKKATTDVRPGNQRSSDNLKKFGFKAIGEIDDDWQTMELDLTNPEVIKRIDEVLNAG